MAYVTIGKVEWRHINQFIYQITRTITNKIKLCYMERVVGGIFSGWMGTVLCSTLSIVNLGPVILDSIVFFKHPYLTYATLSCPFGLILLSCFPGTCSVELYEVLAVFLFIKPHRFQLAVTIMAK